jgi:putative methyltransferase
MLNLLLVQPVDSYGLNKFLPLAISYQWVFARTDQWVKENWRVTDVIIEKFPIKEYVENLENIDLVAMSCYVWNWEYNLQLAKEIKKKFPKCKVIVGGPNVDKRNRNFFKKNPQIDYAIIGEGELAFKDFLSSFSNGTLSSENFLTKKCNSNNLPVRLDNLNQIPSPILEGFYDKIFELYKNRGNDDTKWQVTWETLRGCPYHCAFCDIGDSYWNKVKTFEIDRIFQEIDWMSKNKIEYVSVCDSNWGMLDRDKVITDYFIQKKKETGFPKFVDFTWAKNNSDRIFEIAKKENNSQVNLIKGITFAMQSFNPSTLKATDRFNIKDETLEYYFKQYKKEDIPTYSELIWPLPNETYTSLKNGIQYLVDLGQKDFLMIHPLVLTPNAPMGQESYRKKWQLKTKTVPLDTFYLKIENSETYVVEYTEAVCATNTADYETVIKGMIFGYLFITMYYYGWAYAIMEYFSKHFKIKHIDFIEHMLDYFQNTESLIGSELFETETSIRNVFEKGKFWGRTPTSDIDILWEYKSATSIIFDLDRRKLYRELENFLKDKFNFEFEDLSILNYHLCFEYSREYPYSLAIDRDLMQTVLGIKSSRVVFDHWDKSVKNRREFQRKAFHQERKKRYWRCQVKSSKE